jgi:hypothetical protein
MIQLNLIKHFGSCIRSYKINRKDVTAIGYTVDCANYGKIALYFIMTALV